jgi:hypothetical protein
MFFSILAGGILAYIAYKYDEITIFAKKKYDKWISLNDMVSTQYKKADNSLKEALSFREKKDIIRDRIMIKYVSIKMVLTSLYSNILEYYNYMFGTKIRKIDKNKYCLTYVVHNKIYKMILTPLRGPPPVLRISDQNDNDITEKVEEYLGIHYDFHNIAYKPSFFDCDTMNFDMLNGDTLTFARNAEIKFK